MSRKSRRYRLNLQRSEKLFFGKGNRQEFYVKTFEDGSAILNDRQAGTRVIASGPAEARRIAIDWSGARTYESPEDNRSDAATIKGAANRFVALSVD